MDGLNISLHNIFHQTALILSLTVGSTDINKLIISHIRSNYDIRERIELINYKTFTDQTPIMIITENNQTELFKLFYRLFHKEISLGSQMMLKILCCAIKNSNTDIFDLVIANFPINTTDSDGMTVAMCAVDCSKLSVAKKIICRSDFDVNIIDESGKNILIHLLKNKYEYKFSQSQSENITIKSDDVMGIYCNKINFAPWTPSHCFGNDPIASPSTEFNFNIGTPIFNTDIKENIDINLLIQYVISKKINCNLSDVDGKTPLIHAIDNSDSELFALITKSECFDPNYQSVEGKTYAMILVDKIYSSNHTETYSTFLFDLIKNDKLDINMTDYLNNTLLMYVCKLDNVNILKNILKIKNISTDTKNYRDESALTILLNLSDSESEHNSIDWLKIKILLEYGANSGFVGVRSKLSAENLLILRNISRKVKSVSKI